MKRLSKKHCPLPENYANRILDLEIKIQDSCKLEDINQIVDLYSSAIEFYESIQDEAYLIYQKRLQKILSRKDVLSILNPRPKALPKSPLMDFNSPTNRLAEQRKLENTLKLFTQGSLTTRILAQDNIKKQEDSFEHKLLNRRNSRSRPGSRENSIEKPSIEEFEKALEQLIEKLVTEKIKKIEAVNLKYEKLIENAKCNNCENDPRTVKEFEICKAKEIKDLVSKLENERKFEIATLKNVYNKT